ncbi:MAG: uridine kinase [Pelagibacteraceae bacterium]
MYAAKSRYLDTKKKYLNFLKKQEVLGEPFFDKLGQLNNFYIPICDFINKKYQSKLKTIVIGLSGGQGSGKTTITEILKLILKTKYKLNTINFSIDDFYKTRKERKKMSKNVHQLFYTRGVPGTHDIKLLKKTFKLILNKKFKTFNIPKFDKSIDDRYPKNKWRKVRKKPNIVIFEGWCVGAEHQKTHQLKKPTNLLEKKFDENLIWRKKVNKELKTRYNKLFNLIDSLIFLKVPSFKYVYKWRLLQEKKLKVSSKGKKTMNKIQVKNFIMYYERITNYMLKNLSQKSDILVTIDKKHRLNKIKFN